MAIDGDFRWSEFRMHRLLSRTSITIDEAISILLGWSTGPIDFESTDEVEEEEDGLFIFDLRDELDEKLGVLTGDYSMAKREKQPANVIAEKLAALRHQEEIIEQANVHLAAIRDELNKGERSELKVDTALSNAAYTYVTLHSFNEWQKRRVAVADAQPVGAEVADADRVSVKNEKKPRDKGIRQQDAILAELERLGFDPKRVPKNPSGKGDVKAAVRLTIAIPPLFPSYKVFDDQWQELRNRKRIADETGPSSPQKVEGGDL